MFIQLSLSRDSIFNVIFFIQNLIVSCNSLIFQDKVYKFKINLKQFIHHVI